MLPRFDSDQHRNLEWRAEASATRHGGDTDEGMVLVNVIGMNRFARAIIHKVGHRGAALLFFGLLDSVYAFSLLNPPSNANLSASLAFIENIAPFQFWGVIWAVGGAACLVSAFLTNDRFGFTAAMLVKMLWGALYVYGTLLGVERAYLAAVIWLCLAGWVGIISSWPAPSDPRDFVE